MSHKQPYTYTVLRYVHDTGTGDVRHHPGK